MRVAGLFLAGFLVLWLPFVGVCRFQWWEQPVCGVALHPKYKKALKHYDQWKKTRQPHTAKAILND